MFNLKTLYFVFWSSYVLLNFVTYDSFLLYFYSLILKGRGGCVRLLLKYSQLGNLESVCDLDGNTALVSACMEWAHSESNRAGMSADMSYPEKAAQWDGGI